MPRSPAFLAVSILSIGLGIGANTTIFTVINAVLLRPLPVEEPAQLVSIYTLDRRNPGYFLCSYPNYQEYLRQNDIFSGLILYSSTPVTMNLGRRPEQTGAQIVTGNYFRVLGVKPVLGRDFLSQEDQVPGAFPVVVISYSLWKTRFGGDPQISGKTIRLNDTPFTIVGVAPPEFHGANALVSPNFWIPMMMYEQVLPTGTWLRQRRALLFTAIGRLKPGVDLRRAASEMQTIAHRLEQEYPQDNEGRTVTLIPLSEAVIHPNSRDRFLLATKVLTTAVALVLLIACANVANLLLVRASGRSKEIAIRLSLGAGRWRLIRQLLTESLVLSAIGGIVGLALARWGRDLLWAARPASMVTSRIELTLDSHVLLFTFALSILTGLIFGLAPAWQTTHTDLVTALKERGSQFSALRRKFGLRAVLVMAQVALAVVALSGAGLFIRSLRQAQNLDVGFDAGHLLVLSFNLARRGYSAPAGQEFLRAALERARQVAGVEAVTLSTNPPFQSPTARTIVIDGETATAEGQGALTLLNRVEPGYLQTLRIPLESGRDFSDRDMPNTPVVAIVNHSLARRFWRGPVREAIGKRFHFFGETATYEVVGVVRDSAYQELSEPPRAMVYLSLRQSYAPAVTLYARASGDPARCLGDLRRQVQSLDPDLLLVDVMTVPQALDRSLWAPQLGAALLSIFGALALLLASVGLYGVISYSVSQRVQEIGIRMALGARPTDVLRQVMGEGMSMVGWGIGAGLLAAFAGARVMTRLLFGISPADVTTYLVVVALLGIVAAAACYIPARRATRIDPVLALRAE